MSELTPSRRAENLRLREAATPGPWVVNANYPVLGESRLRFVEANDSTVCRTSHYTHDVEYIVAACNDLPLYEARIAELEAAKDFPDRFAMQVTITEQAAEISRLREERALSVDREYLGQLVRIAWMRWAKEQPDCKPSWIESWAELPERLREVDRQIGEFVASQCVTPELLRVETERDRLRSTLAEREAQLAEALRMVGEMQDKQVSLCGDSRVIGRYHAKLAAILSAALQPAEKDGG